MSPRFLKVKYYQLAQAQKSSAEILSYRNDGSLVLEDIPLGALARTLYRRGNLKGDLKTLFLANYEKRCQQLVLRLPQTGHRCKSMVKHDHEYDKDCHANQL